MDAKGVVHSLTVIAFISPRQAKQSIVEEDEAARIAVEKELAYAQQILVIENRTEELEANEKQNGEPETRGKNS